jgi:hypothetical protein
MATSTGTFTGNTDLLIKLNTFLTANGWTKLRGETDQANASPKAARYWRIVVLEVETTSNDFREIELMEWRTTTGGANIATTGANYQISSIGSGTGADLVSGTTPVISADIDDSIWYVRYDFGSATIIREITIMADTDNYAPRDFYVQWSKDDYTWTTMAEYSGLAWVDNETKTFTWDTGSGYSNPRHPSATISRRSGSEWQLFGSSVFDKYNEVCNNHWTWQGPGFDAARRVYAHAFTYSDDIAGDDHTGFQVSTENDLSKSPAEFLQQVGSPDSDGIATSFLVTDAAGGSYWFYVNSTRFIVVTRAGIADYTSAYVGFMAQYALPDDYPFPLYVAATTDSDSESLSSTNADVRDAMDPGNNQKAKYRDAVNVWKSVTNHNGDAGRVNDPVPSPASYIYPFHDGGQGRNVWPDSTIGDHTNWDAHWLDRIDPTVQGDLPFIPLIIANRTDGHVGALDGVFATPRGGVLSPEQVVTISGVNYRVFPTRQKTNGMNFYAIIET